jgi:hypothetical protein
MEKQPESESELIYAAPAFTNEDEGITFIGDSELIDINQYEELIWHILKSSTGHFSKTEIMEQCTEYTDQPPDLVEAVIDDLESLRILLPASKQHRRFHSLTNNPQSYAQELGGEALRQLMDSNSLQLMEGTKYRLASTRGEVASLSRERNSTRNFETEPLSIHHLGEILNGAYSRLENPVPSAGGLDL